MDVCCFHAALRIAVCERLSFCACAKNPPAAAVVLDCERCVSRYRRPQLFIPYYGGASAGQDGDCGNESVDRPSVVGRRGFGDGAFMTQVGDHRPLYGY